MQETYKYSKSKGSYIAGAVYDVSMVLSPGMGFIIVSSQRNFLFSVYNHELSKAGAVPATTDEGGGLQRSMPFYDHALWFYIYLYHGDVLSRTIYNLLL